MNLFCITIEIRISCYCQEMYVSLTRLTITSLLHIKMYSNETLDWDIFGSNMLNS